MMQWGYKLVAVDLTTDDHQGGRFRYRLGEWHDVGGTVHNNPCPQHPGDGLCVARTLTGAHSGGARIGSSTMLVVGWEPGDMLADSPDKVRVSRLWVHPDPLDPVRILATPAANLSAAYLSRAILPGAILPGADLSGAYLSGAYLSGAILSGADLSGAYLSGAYLSGAILPGADLSDANLSGADLSGADLFRANLFRANLSDADLSGADLFRADLYGANIGTTTRPEWLPDRWTVNASGYITENR